VEKHAQRRDISGAWDGQEKERKRSRLLWSCGRVSMKHDCARLLRTLMHMHTCAAHQLMMKCPYDLWYDSLLSRIQRELQVTQTTVVIKNRTRAIGAEQVQETGVGVGVRFRIALHSGFRSGVADLQEVSAG